MKEERGLDHFEERSCKGCPGRAHDHDQGGTQINSAIRDDRHGTRVLEGDKLPLNWINAGLVRQTSRGTNDGNECEATAAQSDSLSDAISWAGRLTRYGRDALRPP
jgi:hypothetical protein